MIFRWNLRKNIYFELQQIYWGWKWCFGFDLSTTLVRFTLVQKWERSAFFQRSLWPLLLSTHSEVNIRGLCLTLRKLKIVLQNRWKDSLFVPNGWESNTKIMLYQKHHILGNIRIFTSHAPSWNNCLFCCAAVYVLNSNISKPAKKVSTLFWDAIPSVILSFVSLDKSFQISSKFQYFALLPL